jgi:hypothetical protein
MEISDGAMVAFCIACSLVGVVQGMLKGRLIEGFFAGLLAGPIGLIWLVFQNPRATCGFCRKRIDAKALVCPHCQRDRPQPGLSYRAQPHIPAATSPALIPRHAPPVSWRQAVWIAGWTLFGILTLFVIVGGTILLLRSVR